MDRHLQRDVKVPIWQGFPVTGREYVRSRKTGLCLPVQLLFSFWEIKEIYIINILIPVESIFLQIHFLSAVFPFWIREGFEKSLLNKTVGFLL